MNRIHSILAMIFSNIHPRPSFGALGEAVMGLDMNELAFHLLLQRAMLVAVLWHTSSSLPKLFI